MTDSKIMAIDIGGGTQDILLFDPAEPLENAVKLVLPSPTVIAARRIEAVTRRRQAVFLTGSVMGGGAVSRAIKAHLRAGLPCYCQPDPALTLHDNLDKVRGMGVALIEKAPPVEAVEIRLGDLDMAALKKALALFEVNPPDLIALAIQDHGFSPNASNRLTRFAQWQQFLDGGGEIGSLLYPRPPEGLSRMAAADRAVPGAYFMDTGAAALRGAMLDETAAECLDKGLLAVNAGNEHTVAALIKGRRVWGVYEHHTSLLDRTTLAGHMERFAAGTLTHQEIFDQWGHGVAYQPGYAEMAPFTNVVITGPRRALAEGLGRMAAPYGEMMLSGCFGLIEAVREYTSGASGRI